MMEQVQVEMSHMQFTFIAGPNCERKCIVYFQGTGWS